MTFLRERISAVLEPPRYLVPPAAGIDLSFEGVRAVRLARTPVGITLVAYAHTRVGPGAITEMGTIESAAVADSLARAAKHIDIHAANVSLPDEHLETVSETLAAYDAAGLTVRSLETVSSALARALLPRGEEATVLILDIGKTKTMFAIIAEGEPKHAAPINLGGHALTLAVQKYFGVTEEEARRIKTERGIVSSEDAVYLQAMQAAVFALRNEVVRRVEEWQGRANRENKKALITRVILVGSNVSVRGLPEYFETALRVPVVTGNVFTNFASSDTWLPPLPYAQSLSYAGAIGLALKEYEH